MNITLRQLRTFTAVARHKSFTRAAEELHLTQPAVSMQIKQLEEQVGLPLFEHLGRRIHLTDAGKEVFVYGRVMLQQLDDLGTALDNLKGLSAGKLRISAISTANYFAPRLLADFQRHHPGVAVTLDITNREAILAQLDDNETDMAIMGAPPKGRELEAGAFMDNPLVIVAPPDHPLAEIQRIPMQRLEEETFLVREPGSGTRGAMERFFKEHGLKLKTGMEMGSLEAIKQSVEAGLGLAIVPLDAIDTELRLGLLVTLEAADFPIRRQWFVVHRKGKRLSAAAQAFKDFLLDEAAGLLGKTGPVS